jgi:excisionase family DNA binding protein
MSFSPIEKEVGTAPYLDLQAASRYLGGASPRTLRRWIAAGRLPAYQPGGKLLVRRADLDDLMTKARVQVHDLDAVVQRVLEEMVQK